MLNKNIFFDDEYLYWKDKSINQIEFKAGLEALNRDVESIILFEINGRTVSIVKKDKPLPEAYEIRAEHYKSFLTEVLESDVVFRGSQSYLIALSVNDGEYVSEDFPLFAFQKDRKSHNFLLPDIDFLVNRFYDDPIFEYSEPRYIDKKSSAVFVGSTTGAPRVFFDLSDIEMERVPRIKSATYFKNSPNVVFKLPQIVQCDSDVRDFLIALGLGGDFIPFTEQLEHKFLLSMDGNGATCSRIVLALKSRSVLLKYDSNSVLFYFKGMQPWEHYIPIHSDEDVLKTIELENQDPDLFLKISHNANKFHKENLTKKHVVTYTRKLLSAYKSLFLETPNKSFLSSLFKTL